MARDIPIGNGQLLIAYDPTGIVRDLYYPHVGQENHVDGAKFRVGLWEDGLFAWLPEGWEQSVRYLEDTLVTEIIWSHPGRQLTVTFHDLVDFRDNLYLRRITVDNTAGRVRNLRLFFGFDFSISGNDVGDTAAVRPEAEGLLHYKNDRYFLINALLRGRRGFDQLATGNKRRNEFEGTWKDAEDGSLSGNAIAQGSVDSVAALHLTLAPGTAETAWLWICAGMNLAAVRDLNQDFLKHSPTRRFQRTHDYWRLWATKEPLDLQGLPEAVAWLYKRSLLVMRTQIDRNGAIIAANDSDNVQFNRDTYSYVWPRDGALVAQAMDLAGYPETSCAFFKFCAAIVEPEGYFLHKYTPSGMPASSWHPWVKDAEVQLPIQEDETALVLWALWEHYRRYRDLDFITTVYQPLIKNCANFLMNYRDPDTGLPLPSYDLWEERQAVTTFTTAAVYGGLMAAAHFVALFGEEDLAADYRAGAITLREAALARLFSRERGGFARAAEFAPGAAEPQLDWGADASACGIFAFGMLPPDDPAVNATMQHLREKLWCRTPVGGMARYENDPYYHADSQTPGNPWFVTTLLLAQYLIANAQAPADLAAALELLNWCVKHARPSGVLAEQIDPHSGQLLSVSPLTWSHAAFVTTVCQYLEKSARLTGPTV